MSDDGDSDSVVPRGIFSDAASMSQKRGQKRQDRILHGRKEGVKVAFKVKAIQKEGDGRGRVEDVIDFDGCAKYRRTLKTDRGRTGVRKDLLGFKVF